MVHTTANRELEKTYEVRVMGPSHPYRGMVAEKSFRDENDVVIMKGTATGLRTIQFAFASLPGLYAQGIVRAIDYALQEDRRQLTIPGC